jgi:exodeoxyribonuclease VII small subunit
MVEQPAGEDLDVLTYEELLDRLETVVSQMAAGDIGIEQVADLYERAGRLQAAAAERLERVRARIEGLAAADHPGPAGQGGPTPAAEPPGAPEGWDEP